jgi:hypothetical protein
MRVICSAAIALSAPGRFHDDRLFQLFLEGVAHDAGRRVGGPARREADDEADGLVGILG